MNSYEACKWNHPSMRNRVDAEIEAMESSWHHTAPEVEYERRPWWRKLRRAPRPAARPTRFVMVWRF